MSETKEQIIPAEEKQIPKLHGKGLRKHNKVGFYRFMQKKRKKTSKKLNKNTGSDKQ